MPCLIPPSWTSSCTQSMASLVGADEKHFTVKISANLNVDSRPPPPLYEQFCLRHVTQARHALLPPSADHSAVVVLMISKLGQSTNPKNNSKHHALQREHLPQLHILSPIYSPVCTHPKNKRGNKDRSLPYFFSFFFPLLHLDGASSIRNKQTNWFLWW